MSKQKEALRNSYPHKKYRENGQKRLIHEVIHIIHHLLDGRIISPEGEIRNTRFVDLF